MASGTEPYEPYYAMQTPSSASPPQLPAPSNKDDCNWAMFAHLSGFVYLIPFGHLLLPYLIWRSSREKSPFIADQALEALNAQISYSVYALAAGILCMILIGFPLLILLWLAHTVLVIWAAVKASGGTAFRYPFILRMVQ